MYLVPRFRIGDPFAEVPKWTYTPSRSGMQPPLTTSGSGGAVVVVVVVVVAVVVVGVVVASTTSTVNPPDQLPVHTLQSVVSTGHLDAALFADSNAALLLE
jgi:hypothetical protein